MQRRPGRDGHVREPASHRRHPRRHQGPPRNARVQLSGRPAALSTPGLTARAHPGIAGAGPDSAGANTYGCVRRIPSTTAPATRAPIAIATGALKMVARAPAWVLPIGPTPI